MTLNDQLQALRRDVDLFAGANLDTPLASLPHWGSLAVLLVIQHCETQHGLALTGTQIRGCSTVSDLLALIPQQP